MHPGRGTPREPKRVIALRLVAPRVGLEEYLVGELFGICAATATTPVCEFDGSRAERADGARVRRIKEVVPMRVSGPCVRSPSQARPGPA
jgi:hypothetical protein